MQTWIATRDKNACKSCTDRNKRARNVYGSLCGVPGWNGFNRGSWRSKAKRKKRPKTQQQNPATTTIHIETPTAVMARPSRGTKTKDSYRFLLLSCLMPTLVSSTDTLQQCSGGSTTRDLLDPVGTKDWHRDREGVRLEQPFFIHVSQASASHWGPLPPTPLGACPCREDLWYYIICCCYRCWEQGSVSVENFSSLLSPLTRNLD